MNFFKIDIPSSIKLALNKLHNAEYEAYVVGGCVRDALLGKVPHDWDIATSATPREIQELFNSFKQITTGLKHGTVMVVIDNELVEITTFRIDGEYSDGRRPDKVSYTTNISEDLSRRDFTINACAATESILIDPFGGEKDAANKLIRCVGNPVKRFTEDALRILRGIRFASVLNFNVEEKTKEAMHKCRGLLENVSQERITEEFCKTLLGNNVSKTLSEFKDIIAYIIPEISDMIGFSQNNPYHIYNVYEHSLKAVESIESNLVLRICMFFHDIAKPQCYSIDNKNVGHFYGHPEVSAAMAEKILRRMRFSNEKILAVTELIKYHDLQIGLTSKSIKKQLSKLGKIQFRRLLKVKRADILAQSPSKAQHRLKDLDKVEEILNEIIQENSCVSLHDLAINGSDLIKIGIPEGKQIGLILYKLLEMVINEEVENNREDLIRKLPHIL